MAVHFGRPCWDGHDQNNIAKQTDACLFTIAQFAFAATDFLHRTVQILVTIYIWNCGCLMSLNNIEQTATKTEQQGNYCARQVSCDDVLNLLAGFKSRHSRSAHTPDPPPPPSHVSLLQGVCRDCLVKTFQRKGTTKRSCTYDSMLYLQTFSPDLYRH
jgi:hypothetical protein